MFKHCNIVVVVLNVCLHCRSAIVLAIYSLYFLLCSLFFEVIETTLLAKAQGWLADKEVLNAMMSEDPAVIEERKHLHLVRSNIKKALEKMDEIVPGCIPKSPSTL
jgi:hypothetical protein